MTTMPPKAEAGLPPGTELHQVREFAESFGHDAERYQRARPSYPQAMVDAILAAAGGRDFLDIGTGTGISALPFLRAGRRVLGIEPDPRMAQVARRSGLEIEVGKFEDWDPAGRTFDVVIAGQAWHWVDPTVGATKVAGLLKPGGRVALFWNAMLFPPGLAEPFSDVYRRAVPEFPFFQTAVQGGVASYEPLFDKAIKSIEGAKAFEELEQWQFDWQRAYTTAEWLDNVPTFGGHSQIPPVKLSELLEGIARVIDAVGGAFTMGYNTVVVTAKRK